MSRFAGSASEAYYMDFLNELIFEFTSVWLLIKHGSRRGTSYKKGNWTVGRGWERALQCTQKNSQHIDMINSLGIISICNRKGNTRDSYNVRVSEKVTETALLMWEVEEQHQVKAELKGAKHSMVTKDRNIPAFLQPQSGGISKSLPLRFYCLRRQPRHWEVLFQVQANPPLRNSRILMNVSMSACEASKWKPGTHPGAWATAQGKKVSAWRKEAKWQESGQVLWQESTWYNDICVKLCLSHRCVKTSVQAFVSEWPSRREQCRLLSLWSWFALFWMHMHEMLANTVISPW